MQTYSPTVGEALSSLLGAKCPTLNPFMIEEVKQRPTAPAAGGSVYLGVDSITLLIPQTSEKLEGA